MVNEVAVVPESKYRALAMSSARLQEVMSENLGDGDLSVMSLPRVKVPAGGQTEWLIPSVKGTQSSKELRGVIVAFQDQRAYWRTDNPTEGTPPDCVASNGKFGIGDPGGSCFDCPLAEFGSKTKNGVPETGQACKASRMLALLRPNGLLPIILMVPPTSLKNVKGYFVSLTAEDVSYLQVETILRLEKASSRGGQTYSRIAVESGEALSDAETDRARAYNKLIKPALLGARPQAMD